MANLNSCGKLRTTLLVFAALLLVTLPAASGAKFIGLSISSRPYIFLNYSFDYVSGSLWGSLETDRSSWVGFGFSDNGGSVSWNLKLGMSS